MYNYQIKKLLIKNAQKSKSSLSNFDLLGSDETALSKAFAFLLGSDIDCYFIFLKFLGLRYKKSHDHYCSSKIQIENKRIEGRTDIEIENTDKYHIIIECKVRGNRLSRQRTQYLNSFPKENSTKILCFITQERDTNKQVTDDVTIINCSWYDIIELFNDKHNTSKPLVSQFLKFAIKNYKMRELKEILIQDVNIEEINRFEVYGVYRRDQTFGTPIYFAPYYTKNTSKLEGISNLSKIMGILTLKPSEIDEFVSDLESFSSNQIQVENWVNGVKYGDDKLDNFYTYYFLDEPIKFKNPLLKDGGIKKGRGKNWIAA